LQGAQITGEINHCGTSASPGVAFVTAQKAGLVILTLADD